jgi:hypothetical protein
LRDAWQKPKKNLPDFVGWQLFLRWLSRPCFRKKPVIEDAQRMLAEHIEPGFHWNPETTIKMLLSLLDRRELRSDGSAPGTGCAL